MPGDLPSPESALGAASGQQRECHARSPCRTCSRNTYWAGPLLPVRRSEAPQVRASKPMTGNSRLTGSRARPLPPPPSQPRICRGPLEAGRRLTNEWRGEGAGPPPVSSLVGGAGPDSPPDSSLRGGRSHARLQARRLRWAEGPQPTPVPTVERSKAEGGLGQFQLGRGGSPARLDSCPRPE